MKILSKPSFARAFKKLTFQQQGAVNAVIVGLADKIGKPHLHSGLGIRPFGNYLECRVDLRLRVLFYLFEGNIILATTGHHDAIARYVKDN